VGVGEIELDRATQHPKSLDIGLAVRLVVQDLAGQDVFVGRHVCCGLSLDAVVSRGLQAPE
jgi:hypothetical protein